MTVDESRSVEHDTQEGAATMWILNVNIYQIPIRIAHKPKREPQIKFKSCNTPGESKSPNRKTKTK